MHSSRFPLGQVVRRDLVSWNNFSSRFGMGRRRVRVARGGLRLAGTDVGEASPFYRAIRRSADGWGRIGSRGGELVILNPGTATIPAAPDQRFVPTNNPLDIRLCLFMQRGSDQNRI